MSLKVLISQLWIAGMVLQALLAIVLLVKKAWRNFPIFTLYTIFGLVVGVSLYTLRLSRLSYLKVYWGVEMLGLLLGFGIFYEIFRTLLNSYPALRALARSIFLWSALGLMLLGCIVFYSQSSTDHNPLMSTMLVVEEATRTIEVGLLIFLFLFASAFGLHWRQYLFGVALGFGIFISVELVAVSMRLHFGSTALVAVNFTRIIAFNLSLLTWLGYLLIPEPTARNIDLPKLAQLEQWNQALMELIHQ